MLKIDFTTQEIQKLQQLQSLHPHHVIRRRPLALVLKSQDIPHNKIAKIIDVSENTLRSYFKNYAQRGGVEQLKIMNFYQPQNSLKPFESVVK